MTDIDEMKIRRLDITLLLVFLHMMRARKAVVVAERMGLTQSSISHALGRLRDIFDDQLFLRQPHGMEPTAIAMALEPVIRAAVAALSNVLAKPEPFDPATANGLIRIAAFDSQLAVIVPELMALLERRAPGLKVTARALGRQDAYDALENGSVDLAAGFFWDMPASVIGHLLHDEDYLTVARKGHPLFEQPLDLDRFVTTRHLIVSPAGDLTGIVDQALERLGLKRDVVCAVPLFFPALATLARSDLVATLPATLVRRHAADFGLDHTAPPLQIRSFPVSVIRHRRNEKNPLLDFIVGHLTGEMIRQ